MLNGRLAEISEVSFDMSKPIVTTNDKELLMSSSQYIFPQRQNRDLEEEIFSMR